MLRNCPRMFSDVAHGPFVGMDAPADGGVLGGEAKGIEAHGVQHVVALHTTEAGMAVGRGHGVPVADVEVAGGVGVHGHLIPAGAVVVLGDAVDAVGFPALLPFFFEGDGVVS